MVLPIISADITVEPNRDIEVNEIIVVALYIDGRLLEMKQIKEGDNRTVTVTKLADADTIKVMWWDRMNTMEPLCDYKEVKYNGTTWVSVN